MQATRGEILAAPSGAPRVRIQQGVREQRLEVLPALWEQRLQVFLALPVVRAVVSEQVLQVQRVQRVRRVRRVKPSLHPAC